tara:strand:+ start:41 stop:550 length:510 start_codon:yes stop_codon:yes gene_type:complete
MKSKKNLVLLGMMGSGKSTIGSFLAKRLNLRFYDVDHEIESKIKMSISEIFEKKGEIEFRSIEEKMTLNLLNKVNCVISLGGGGFVNNKIRKETQKSKTIWLDCNAKIIINRIRKNKKRPLIENLSDNEIKKLIFSRSKVYSKSKYRINCNNMTKKEIVDKIVGIHESF